MGSGVSGEKKCLASVANRTLPPSHTHRQSRSLVNEPTAACLLARKNERDVYAR